MDLDEGRRLALDELGRLGRAGQGVPVGVEPAGGQDQRELVVGRLARGLVRPGEEPGPAVGGREVAVEVEALGAGMVDARAGPVQVPDVAGAARR